MKRPLDRPVVSSLVVIIGAYFLFSTSSSGGTVVAWGESGYGLTDVPVGVGSIASIAASYTHNLLVREDGTVFGWGDDTYQKASGTLDLSGIVQVAAGAWHSIALRNDGMVIVWGQSEYGQRAIPAGLSSVKAIAAGGHHNLALTSVGTVVAWGYNGSGELNVPPGLENVVAIAAGYSHSLALTSDGHVVSWGSQANVPPGLINVVAIAGGFSHSLALRSDGTVLSWGSMNQNTVPAGLTNVVDIAAGTGYSLALKSDGTVVTWGSIAPPPSGLTNVMAVSAGASHSLALVGDGSPSRVTVYGPFGGRVYAGNSFTFRPQVRGSGPFTYQWRKAGVDLLGETNFFLSMTNVHQADAGYYSVVVSNFLGAVTSRVARLSVVKTGAPEIKADGATLFEDVIRGDQSTISISTLFSNGTIFYTTDGSKPDFVSIPYVAPFVVTQSTTVRAVAYNLDFTESAEDGPYLIQIVPTYALLKSIIGQGSISQGLLSRYPSGIAVTMAAFPAAGWRFLRWEGDACGSSTGVNIVMDQDKTVTAVFEAIPKYALSVTTPGGGTISGNTGSPYLEGTGANLTAQPAEGWQFLRWEGDATGTNLTVAVAMDRAKNVQALFGTLVGTSGTVTLTPMPGPYPYGSTVRVWARPTPGSYFAVWGSAGSGRVNPLPFVVTNPNPTISALFLPLQGSDVNVYVNVEGQGTVVASPNTQPYPSGTQVTLTASPVAGWRFVQWQGDASGTSTNTTILLNTSKTVTAIFEALPRFTLTATTQGGGAVTGNTDSSYAAGDIVNLMARPALGWEFLRWEGDAGGISTNLTVTMNISKSIQAVFVTSAPLINNVGPGSVTLNPPQGLYAYGSIIRLTASPGIGAHFAGWGNGANSSDNPLDFIVTNGTPAICALFASGENNTPLVISSQPQNQSVVQGSNATFQLSVNGASPFVYQWRKDGSPIPGAVSATFVIHGVNSNDVGSFDVIVSNSFNSITSSVATLTVLYPPAFSTQPVDRIVSSGNFATFHVAATGTDPLNYQWYNNAGPMTGSTNAQLVITPATTNVAGNYFAVVSNPYGTATSAAAHLTVFVPAAIAVQPAQQVVPFRGTANFNAAASGYPTPSYQWMFNGQPLAAENRSSLVITNVGTNDLGGYFLVVSNPYSAATSSVANLLMSPSLRSSFLGDTAVWGKSATLSASAIGSGTLTYQWFKDGEAIPGGTSGTLSFPTIQLNDAGMYSLVVSSEWGSVTNTPAQLVVNPANISLAMYAGVTIDGVAGYTYGIQYNTDLRNTNTWVTITNYTLTLPVETWIDMDSVGRLKRFYRVVVP